MLAMRASHVNHVTIHAPVDLVLISFTRSVTV